MPCNITISGSFSYFLAVFLLSQASSIPFLHHVDLQNSMSLHQESCETLLFAAEWRCISHKDQKPPNKQTTPNQNKKNLQTTKQNTTTPNQTKKPQPQFTIKRKMFYLAKLSHLHFVTLWVDFLLPKLTSPKNCISSLISHPGFSYTVNRERATQESDSPYVL